MNLPRASDSRSIDWATRHHRTSHRKTAVGQRSHAARCLRQHFTLAFGEIDESIDRPVRHRGAIDLSHGYAPHERPKRHIPLRSRLS
jgi:hypothetical protein